MLNFYLFVEDYDSKFELLRIWDYKFKKIIKAKMNVLKSGEHFDCNIVWLRKNTHTNSPDRHGKKPSKITKSRVGLRLQLGGKGL